jgi:hypothetical protein
MTPTNNGENRPSPKQLAYLRSLANRVGQTFAYPRTTAQASAEIRRLKAARPSTKVEREIKRLDDRAAGEAAEDSASESQVRLQATADRAGRRERLGIRSAREGSDPCGMRSEGVELAHRQAQSASLDQAESAEHPFRPCRLLERRRALGGQLLLVLIGSPTSIVPSERRDARPSAVTCSARSCPAVRVIAPNQRLTLAS